MTTVEWSLIGELAWRGAPMVLVLIGAAAVVTWIWRRH